MPRLLNAYSSQPGEPELERVVCASMASSVEAPYEQMERIRDEAVRRNASVGLHVALLYQCGWFVHWLEGPPKAVHDTVQRISRDPRHHSQQILHSSRGQRVLPSPWSMVLMPFNDETTAEVGARVAALRQALMRGEQLAPTSVVRRLCTPFGLTFKTDAVGIEAYHRVGAIAANGRDSFALVNALGLEHGHRISSGRFAGEQDMDSASELVEFFFDDDQPVRIIAVARNGMNQGLRRAFLCDWPHLLMLFTGDDRADEDLMDRVRRACEGLPQPPLLLGVSPLGGTHPVMATQAATDGLRYKALGVMDPADSGAVWKLLAEELRQSGLPEASVWPMSKPALAA